MSRPLSARVHDVYDTMQRVLAEDHHSESAECAKQIRDRWVSKLQGVDIWAGSHCHAALVYAEWDVGAR
jgi:hypothetical protein